MQQSLAERRSAPAQSAVLLERRALGARTFVADALPQRLMLASRLGAELALDPSSDDVEAVIRDHTDGYGADATFEAVGGTSEEPLDLAVRVTARLPRR